MATGSQWPEERTGRRAGKYMGEVGCGLITEECGRLAEESWGHWEPLEVIEQEKRNIVLSRLSWKRVVLTDISCLGGPRMRAPPDSFCQLCGQDNDQASRDMACHQPSFRGPRHGTGPESQGFKLCMSEVWVQPLKSALTLQYNGDHRQWANKRTWPDSKKTLLTTVGRGPQGFHRLLFTNAR